MSKILLTFLFFAVIFKVNAQTCSGPGRAPNSAQAVCGSLTFTETDVSSCTGPDLFNFTCTGDVVSTDNSRWYKFHCYTSGTFGFLLTPANSGDDYDWAVMDITGRPATDVYTTNLVISLNLSAITGVTGCTATGTLNTHCSGGVAGSQYNQLLNLVAGRDYLLMVTNWTNSGQPYSINFSGTAQLNNNTPPTITNIAVVNCDPSKLQITFSEDILSSTVTPTGSELTISGGPHPITGIVTAGGNSIPSMIVNLATPLAPGPYTLTVANGTDGNTFANICLLFMAPVSIPFTISVTAPPGVTTPVTYCQGATATALTATGTNLLWYTAATGGTGSATAPIPSTASIGTTMYYVSQTIGGCEGTRAAIQVNITTLVTPAFAAVAPVCAGTTLAALPTTSTNGITGTWSPALNNSTTTTYTFTPTTGQCASTTTLTITVNPNITPTFTAVAPICSGATLSPLPTTSNNSITGTWAPALDNTNTTTYTFTPTAGQCATAATMTITVNPAVTPLFTAIAPICSGAALTLPTTSNNGFTGTWSPAINNTNTTTYSFTPDPGQCATGTTMTVTVNPNTIPTFTAVAPICAGDVLAPLPTTSNNGITGSWSPALNNAATTTYTFTPTAGLCATTTTLTITVNPPTVPIFTAVAPICAGGTLSPLPTTSNNGIAGTWSPALDNTTTTTYSFTPAAGQCASITTITITVNPLVTPTFTPVAPICSGATLSPLPTTSNNGITGTWSPALNNTGTTTYTFTPTAGQCAATATMTITVNPVVTPLFTAIAPICSGAALTLPTTSNNGISGTWSPAIDNTNTTVYTFTPNAGQCAVTTTMTVTVNPNTIPTFTPVAPICAGDVLAPLPTTSNNGITGTWSPALNNAGTTTYTFTATAGLCATTTTLTITVNSPTVPTFTAVTPICAGGTLSPLPTTSNNGIAGTWSPALNNAATTTYTFTPNAGLCATTATLTITVNPIITPAFTAIAAICSGQTLSPLPTTSNNGITGTWSPALNNTTTTTYTFTPAAGACATTTTLTIPVNTPTVPTFTAVAPICAGGTLSPLPTTSNNGITGAWLPALDNSTTTTYTFTPTPGVCATAATLTITVNPNIVPTFTAVAPICSGATLSPLPTTSNNGITGTWSPALDNTTTTTYTFTPTAGVCATTGTLTITVIRVTPVFTAVTPICTGSALSPLPTTSNNGITGTWSPALDNTATTTYTFTPTAGQCALNTTLTITVKPYPAVNIGIDTTICEGSIVKFLPIVVPPATSYDWSINPVNVSVPASTIDSIHIKNASVNPADTVQYILKATLNGCAAEDTVQVNVKWKPAVDAGSNVSICLGDSTMLTGFVSHISGIADSLAWTPVDSLRTPTAVNTNIIQTWAAPTGSTRYRLTAYMHQAGYGCEFEVHDSVTVVIPSPVIASAGRDTIAVSGVAHQLYGSGGAQYKWWTFTPSVSINNPLNQNPTVTLTNDAYFFVEVKNSIGCADTASLLVKVYAGPAYYVPNAFSPNGDGLNDVFRAIPPGISTTIYFRVFDRYGAIIFETNQWLKGWDGTYKGKPVPNGVYVWSVKGVDRNNKTIEKQGTVMVVR